MKLSKEQLQLYAITDHTWLNGRSLAAAVEEAILGGATIVQLRDKKMSEEEIIAEAIEIHDVCKRYGVPLIINDSAEIALASEAEGVHVGQDDESIEHARALLGEKAIIGATAHNLAEAIDAADRGADYLGVGAAFGSTTKKDARPIDRSEYSVITSSVDIPVVAIGGINADNISELDGAGLAGAAIVSGIFAAADIRAAAAELKEKCRRL